MNNDELAKIANKVVDGEYNFTKCATRIDGNLPPQIEDVVAAMFSVGTNKAGIARLLGRRRATIARYIETNDTASEVYDEIRQSRFDNMEDGLWAKAELGDVSAARFVLSTLGGSRGYAPGAGDPDDVPPPVPVPFTVRPAVGAIEVTEGTDDA